MQIVQKSLMSLVALSMSLAAFSAGAATDKGQRIQGLKISPTEAVSIATSQAQGEAVELELDLDRDRASYEIEIQGASDKHKIEVDADSGEVLQNRIDKDYFQNKKRREAGIPMQDVIKIAEDATQARVKGVDLEDGKDQNNYYKVETINAENKFKLKIDATDGKIIERKDDK